MTAPSGWVLSIDDGSRPRRFLVAEPQLLQAKALVTQEVPRAEFTKWQRLPEGLFAFAEMKRGDIIEWIAETEIIT
jgi:hypothetical protein